jgi:serine/threonine protein kinase
MECNYEVGRFLGKGSFATVHLARHVRTRLRCAIKIVDVSACEERRRREEGGMPAAGGVVVRGAVEGSRRGRRGRRRGGTTGEDEEDDDRARHDDDDDDYDDEDDGIGTARSSSRRRLVTTMAILRREIHVHSSVSSCRHPNIVRLLESFDYLNVIAGSNMTALVMELCPLGDLREYMRDHRGRGGNTSGNDASFLDVREIRHALSEVLSGLSFLHSRGIVHRDVKAPNIFLSPVITSHQRTDEGGDRRGDGTTKTNGLRGYTLLDCRLKLGDFGLAAQMEDDDDWNECRTTFCGTPTCLAPEVAQRSVHFPQIVASSISSRGRRRRRGGGGMETKEEEEEEEEEEMTTSTDGGDGRLDESSSSPPPRNMRHQRYRRRSHGTTRRITGYGQPADLWSTGCLLYTMIVGRNPFAMPSTATSTTTRGECEQTHMMREGEEEGRADASDEKARRIRQIVDRVVRGDWSVPASVIMSNESMEGLLEQLMEMQPRKRGTARGILNFHPFFQAKFDNTSTSPSTMRTTNQSCIALNEKTNDRNDMGSPGQTIADAFSSESLPKMTIEKNRMQNNENVFRGNVNANGIIPSANKRLGTAETEFHDDQLHLYLSSPRITSNNTEKTPKHESHTSSVADLSRTSVLTGIVNAKNQKEENVIHSNVYKSQKYEHVATGDREQNVSIVSSWSMSSSSDDLRDLKSTSDCDQCARETSSKPFPCFGPIKDNDAVVEMETKTHPFIPMKSLDRLPQRKYSWREPAQNGFSNSEMTVFILGDDGLVIQKESRHNHGLWMHVTSDGLGILWGNLQPQLRQPTQHDANVRSALWLEAYSRAPSEFSKSSLVSLLSLKSHDIVSLYETLEHVVHRVKEHTPMIIVHLYATNKSTHGTLPALNSNDHVAKTMLMGNDPLGDIKTEFADGTTVWLSSADGCITIEGDQGTSKLEIDQVRFFCSLRADRSPSLSCGGMPGLLKPLPKFVHNLCLFMESARECLLLGDRLNHLFGGYTGVPSVRPLAQAHPTGIRQSTCNSFPVVRKYILNGWRREDWVAYDLHLKSHLE